MDLATTAKTLMRGNPHALYAWYASLSDDDKLELWVQLELNTICDVFDQIMEVLREAWRIVSEAIATIVEIVTEFVRATPPAFRRLALYLRLRNWGLPPWLAGLAARRWPERWLPTFQGVSYET